MSSATKQSAAHIVIDTQPTDGAKALQARLAGLLTACGTNKRDRAILLISAAISEGVNTGSAIVELGGRVGLNTKHVGLTLADGEGDDPVRHRWRRDERGIYSLLT